MERKLDEAGHEVDCFHIHGRLTKYEKCWRIQIFCENAEGDIVELNLRVLFSTNALNVGIDNAKIVFGIRYEWPRDLPTYFQERGRLSWILGTASCFILIAGLGSFEFLMSQILMSDNDSDSSATAAEVANMQQQMIGVNSMISPLRENAARDAKRRDARATILQRAEKKRLFEQEHRELLEVIRFFCTDRGCQHSAGAEYLSTGRLGACATSTTAPCKTQCEHLGCVLRQVNVTQRSQQLSLLVEHPLCNVLKCNEING